jgi:hypothetical protein
MYIVNNAFDSLAMPCIDAVVDHISTSVAPVSSSLVPVQWLSYQVTTSIVECGNSFHIRKLPPRTALESNMDNEYTNMGDSIFQYRVELILNEQKIISNAVPIRFMKKQIPYLGKSIA